MPGTRPGTTKMDATLPRSWRRHQIGRRDQHPEGLAPDDDARIVLEIDAGGDRVALTALEGAQPPEINVLDALQVCRAADRRLRHQVDVKRRARPDLEIAF